MLQSDPRFSNKYFNLSKDDEVKGSWNEGISPLMDEEWQLIDDPVDHVYKTKGSPDEKAKGTQRTEKSVQKDNKSLSADNRSEIDVASKSVNGIMSWSVYGEAGNTK